MARLKKWPVWLYPPDADTFGSSPYAPPIGVVHDMISCAPSQEIGGAYDLTATYPLSGEYIDQIVEDNILWAPDPTGANVLAGTDTQQPHYAPFRIYRTVKTQDGTCKIYAHSLSYDLGKYVCEAFTGTFTNPSDAVRRIWEDNFYLMDNPWFAWRISPDLVVPSGWSWEAPGRVMTMRALMADMIKDLPGAWWRYEYLANEEWPNMMLLQQMPAVLNREAEIDITRGDNLLTVKRDCNGDGVITHVLPYWRGSEADETTGEYTEVFVYGDRVSTGSTSAVPRTAALDLTSYFSDKPTSAELTAAAPSHLSDIKIKPAVSIETTFYIDGWTPRGMGKQFGLGYPVHVSDPLTGIDTDLYVMKTVGNSLRGTLEKITAGTPPDDLAAVLMQFTGGGK